MMETLLRILRWFKPKNIGRVLMLVGAAIVGYGIATWRRIRRSET